MRTAPQHWKMLTVTENNDLALGTKALWGGEFFLVPTDSCNGAIRAGPVGDGFGDLTTKVLMTTFRCVRMDMIGSMIHHLSAYLKTKMTEFCLRAKSSHGLSHNLTFAFSRHGEIHSMRLIAYAGFVKSKSATCQIVVKK
jgi:hypothetical protein